MKQVLVIAVMLALGVAACSNTADSADKGKTYRMEKGGMSSTGHDMPASSAPDEDAAKKKEGYRMEKGAMGNVGHDMK